MEKIKMACATDQSHTDHSIPKCFSPFYQREMGKSRDECKVCHGRCDPGELRREICPECAENIRQENLRKQERKEQQERNHRKMDWMAGTINYQQVRMEGILYEQGGI